MTETSQYPQYSISQGESLKHSNRKSETKYTVKSNMMDGTVDRWLRMPFGISNTPEGYQRRHHEVIQG